MNNELMRQVNGTTPVRREQRAVVSQAKAIYNDVRLSAFRTDGVYALGAHIMDGAMELDDHRRQVAGDDPIRNQIAMEIEMTVIKTALGIFKGQVGNF